MRLLVSVLLASALLGVPAQGQSNEQSVVIFHDLTDDGYTYPGTPTNFAFALLNQDGSTNVHKNGRVVVKQNGVVLYETLGYATAHDYDALNTFLVTFPVTGPYEVLAEIGNNPETSLKSVFKGFVEARKDLVQAGLELEAPATTTTGALTRFTYRVVDEQKRLIEHSDVLFEVRDADNEKLVFRTHTHSHRDAQVLDYAFGEAGTYDVRLLAYQAYPTKSDTAFAPVTLVKRVSVTQGSTAPTAPTPVLPGVSGAVPAPPGASRSYRMYTTYDPDPTVGMFGSIRLNTIVYDPETRALVPHIDFVATLKDPAGRVLMQTKSLHEYDGHLEVVTAHSVVGTYQLEVRATDGEWSDSRVLTFNVAPPAVGASANPSFGAGPMIVSAKGIDALKSGTPQALTFSVTTLAGSPWMHSEIDLHVRDKAGVPIYMNKLHTHGDGLFTVGVNFPVAGEYQLVLDAMPIHRDASTGASYSRPGQSIVVPVKVMPGVEIPRVLDEDTPPTTAETGAFAPGISFVPILTALAVALFLGFLGRRP